MTTILDNTTPETTCFIGEEWIKDPIFDHDSFIGLSGLYPRILNQSTSIILATIDKS